MASRGGRNFGRSGPSLPFVTPGEINMGPILQPPPMYLPREKRYEDLPASEDITFLLKRDESFKEFFNQIQNQTATEEENNLKYNWKLLPQELKPKVKAKLIRVKPTIINGEAELNRLEQIERKIDKVNNGEEVNEDDEIIAPEDYDEEMDEGTDYANNYFDNGENYEDMDEGDTGPVY